MTPARLWFPTLIAATLAVYLAMILWSLPRIAAEAGGLTPFDVRPLGYTEAEARDFLAALSASGRAFYLSVQHVLDLIYPALLAATFVVSYRRLFRGWPGAVVAGLFLLPLTGMAADYLENARVADLLRQPPSKVTSEAIAAAGQATILKGLANTACVLILLAGLGRRLWQRRR